MGWRSKFGGQFKDSDGTQTTVEQSNHQHNRRSYMHGSLSRKALINSRDFIIMEQSSKTNIDRR
jgi:hypothetical protein